MSKVSGPARRQRHVAVIPCRWGSSRFPGKPVADLGGRPLLWHVHQRCRQATRLDEVVVATDDERIADVCAKFAITCLMTGTHATGTDRVAECAGYLDADAYINVQGDEPFIDPAAIDAVSRCLSQVGPGVSAVNACAPIDNPATLVDHNAVKVVLGIDGSALMFSRQPIPYPRDDRPCYLRQLGLYGFTAEGLASFQNLKQGPLERAEGIEMLRFLEHSHRVRMLVVQDIGMAVDTPEDLSRAELLLKPQR
ncbi:3-deoxy-manno-octulosonate cytidylyltransferase [Embleya sp. NPDC055664]